MLATVIWFTLAAVPLRTGALDFYKGAWAEEWTSEELRRLRREGWYVVDRIEFDHLDVDHVAVGPGGVYAVETKWLGSTSDRQERLRRAQDQASHGSWKIGRLLAQDGVEVDVRPLVVTWGPGAEGVPLASPPSGAPAVLAGRDLGDWRKEVLKQRALGAGDIEAVRELLQRFVRTRDEFEARVRNGRAAPRSAKLR